MGRRSSIGRVYTDAMVHDVITLMWAGHLLYVVRCTEQRTPPLLKNAETPITCIACLIEGEGYE